MEEIYESSTWKLLADGKCALMEDIIVNFSHLNNRQLCPKVVETMEELWQEKLDGNKRLYNMSKFRLCSVEVDQKICLNVGITDYKETICTNHLPCTKEIQSYGKHHYNDNHACFGDAIGVGGVVVTKDNFIVLIIRSDWVAESKGCYDTPGGHAEPTEMLKKLGIDKSDLFQVKGSDVVYEIFHSFVREVRDEVNVPEASISWPLLLGVMRNIEYGCKPGLAFYVRCNVTRDQVMQFYLRGGPETDESTELKFIHVKELLKDNSVIMNINMAPLGRLALLLFLHHYQTLQNY